MQNESLTKFLLALHKADGSSEFFPGAISKAMRSMRGEISPLDELTLTRAIVDAGLSSPIQDPMDREPLSFQPNANWHEIDKLARKIFMRIEGTPNMSLEEREMNYNQDQPDVVHVLTVLIAFSDHVNEGGRLPEVFKNALKSNLSTNQS